jgi:anaerobic ribonucleoside-triphosphate reductase
VTLQKAKKPKKAQKKFVNFLMKAQQNQALDDSLQELQVLAADINLEERATRVGVEIGSDDNEDDNMDGWIDERERMSAEDVTKLDESVQPVRFMLVKVV